MKPSGWKPCRAQSILEFALIIPLLMLIVLGIIAFGQMFMYRIRLENAAREGARTGVVGGTDAVIIQKIQNRLNALPGITTSCGTAPVGSTPTPGSACMSVAILPNTCAARTNGVDLVVNIRYEAYITVPVIGFFMSPKTLFGRCVMRVEAPNCGQ